MRDVVIASASAKVAPLRTPHLSSDAGCPTGEAQPTAATGRGGATACVAYGVSPGRAGFVEELELKFQVRLRRLPPGLMSVGGRWGVWISLPLADDPREIVTCSIIEGLWSWEMRFGVRGS